MRLTILLLLTLSLTSVFSLFPSAMAVPSARIQNDSRYNFYGTYHVVGEVLNTGDVPLRFIQITVTLKDQNDRVVDVVRGYVYGGWNEFKCMYLPPGQKAPFDILEWNSDKSAQVSSYTLSLEYQQASTPFENLLVIHGVANSTDSQGFSTVAGEVTNNGPETSKFTVVIGTFYDANGRVIYVGFAYPDVVPAGKTRGFELDVNDAQISSRVRNRVLLATTPLPLDHVVINEVLIETEFVESGVVELYNPTTTRADLSGWIIQIKGGTTTTASLPQGTMIDAGGYVVVSAGFPKYSISQGLILRDNHGDEIDSTPSLGWLGMTGFSWQRYPDGSDNWRSSPSTIDAVNMPELPSPLLAAATILLAWGFVLSRKIA